MEQTTQLACHPSSPMVETPAAHIPVVKTGPCSAGTPAERALEQSHMVLLLQFCRGEDAEGEARCCGSSGEAEAKQDRVERGCLGARSRRRARRAAKRDRGVACKRRAGRTRMGQPAIVRAVASAAECIGCARGTGGTETSQYPEEQKSTERPGVVASETGRSPNQWGGDFRLGLEGTPDTSRGRVEPNDLGRSTAGGESPVGGRTACWWCVPEYHGTREILWEAGGTNLQGYVLLATDIGRVP